MIDIPQNTWICWYCGCFNPEKGIDGLIVSRCSGCDGPRKPWQYPEEKYTMETWVGAEDSRIYCSYITPAYSTTVSVSQAEFYDEYRKGFGIRDALLRMLTGH